MKSEIISLFLSIFVNIFMINESTKLTDVTVDLFGTNTNGTIAAFGDFNADKMVDVFVISNAGKKLDILFARQDKSYVRTNLIQLKNTDKIIVNVVPTDIDGDAAMDVMIAKQKQGSKDAPIDIAIYWGNVQTLDPVPLELDVTLRDQPLVLDLDGDMYPDLFGEIKAGERVYLKNQGEGERNFSVVAFPKINDSQTWDALTFPHSSAFVDLNDDLHADMMLTTVKGFEYWFDVNGALVYNYTEHYPSQFNYKQAKQSSFADINCDSLVDQIIPVCMDDGCEKSHIWVYSKMTWILLLPSETMTPVWRFATEAENPGFPITVRIADYNMDSFPDAIVVAMVKQNNEWVQQAVLLENTVCTDPTCRAWGRTFTPDYSTPISTLSKATVATFYDIYENGVLDVMVSSLTGGTGGVEYPTIKAYKQTSTSDTCFMKVTVTSGLCRPANCPSDRVPYGENVIGPAVRYNTTSVEGTDQSSWAGQMCQTSHFALQTPYMVFGLGLTPNFVDEVHVGLPLASSTDRTKTWTQIIPNSQLIVIPYPLDKPQRWSMKLFVTPSQAVLLVGAALLGTCGFVAGIVGILQWKERREDIQEKRQESHKFHFDAM